jgi:type VII secretion protein EccB
MTAQPTAWLHISGYRFLLRRVEYALLHRDSEGIPAVVSQPNRTPTQSLAAGCVLAAVIVTVCAVLALLHPQAPLGNAPIVMGQQSGALYVRVGETLHPVLNLASARLITATSSNPQPVSESALSRTKRGALLGIPGAPQILAEPLSADETRWAVCDTDDNAAPRTTVVVGAAEGVPARRLTAEQAVLVTPDSGAPTYLLYDGGRAVVNLADPTVMNALRLNNVAPHIVSQALLNSVREVPPIAAPRIAGSGGRGPSVLAGFPVGSVVRATRAGGDEYYVVLHDGVQRVGQVAADLVRLANSQGAQSIISVAPDLLGAVATVHELPVSTFPDQAPEPLHASDTTLCALWAPAPPGGADIAFTLDGLPIPAGQAPVILSQADGDGAAVDAVYLRPGSSAYVRSTSLSGGDTGGTRYLVTDTGVRFAVHDDDAARDLGLPKTATPAPWPVLATLPSGPELSRANASVARDTVGLGSIGVRLRPDAP